MGSRAGSPGDRPGVGAEWIEHPRCAVNAARRPDHQRIPVRSARTDHCTPRVVPMPSLRIAAGILLAVPVIDELAPLYHARKGAPSLLLNFIEEISMATP